MARSDSPELLTECLSAGEDQATALVSAGGSLSYRELRAGVRNLAAALRRLGLRGGERALLALSNESAFPTATFAVWRAGGVVVPLDHRSPADQVVRIARDCQATTLVCDGFVFTKLEGRLREIPSLRFVVVQARRPGTYRLHVEVLAFEDALSFDEAAAAIPSRPGDLAGLVYTSGSTGTPRGVMHSHESLISSLVFTRDHLAISPQDRVLVSFPLYHLFSFRVLLAHLLAGARVVLAADILAGLRRVAETRPTALILVPAACALLVERFPAALSECRPFVRRVCVGSAAISPSLLARLQSLLPAAGIHIPYGMTEARIGFLEPVAARAERRLCAVDPNLELEVQDEEGRPIRQGIGEIVVRGRALMQGYWHNRDSENAAIREQGFRTRDLMEVSADGERFLVGRKDDVISVGGEKVFPNEVEAALLAHPAVHDVRVLAADDPRGILGQVVKAAIVLKPDTGFDRDDILAHCRRRLEPYKVPSVLETVTEIPRNEMGKVARIGRA